MIRSSPHFQLATLFPPLALSFLASCVGAPPVASDEGALVLGSDTRLPNRVDTQPLLGGESLEVVAMLPYPAANVAVAASGRVFFTFFSLPQGNHGPMQVAELEDGVPVPYPSSVFQHLLVSAHAIRADAQGRLWVLDHGEQGLFPPRIAAIDLATDRVVFDYTFPRSSGPVGSMFNDFRVSPDGTKIYITDSGIVNGRGALVILDLSGSAPRSHRRLERTEGTANGAYDVFYEGSVVRLLGGRAKFGADPIALDRDGAFLYYGALNGGAIHRVRTADLENTALSDAQLAARVVRHAETPLTDGITIDDDGRLYLTDIERSRIVRVHPDGRLDVLLRDARLRWPDGFSYAPDGSLYLTASALEVFLPQVVVTASLIDANAPYAIFRFDPSLVCAASERCTAAPGQ